MRFFRTCFAVLFCALFPLTPPGVAWAQDEPIFGNTSQVADLNDPFAYALNPALGEMTGNQVAAGFQVLHLGFLANSADLNTGGIVYTTRKFGGGLTLDADYLTTPLWGVQRFRAGFGRRVVAGLSLGLSVGINQRSFDLSSVDLSQGSYVDPLLSGNLNKTVGTTALAAAYSLPWQGLTAGVVLENPHEPNISLDSYDDVVLASILRAGMQWERRFFTLNAGMVDRQYRSTYDFGVRGTFLGEHSLIARYESDQWVVGARLSLSKSAWLEYTYTEPRSDLADLTSGSHGLVVCWRGKGRSHPEVRYSHDRLEDGPYNAGLAADRLAVLPQPPAIELDPVAPTRTFFTVTAEVDTALIRVKRLRRVFGPQVDMAQVRRLPRWRIGVLDSTWSDRVTWDITEGMTEAFPQNDLPRGNYSENYRARMDTLAKDLRDGRGGDLVIAAESDQLDRARYLARKVGADSLANAGSPRVTIKELKPVANEGLRRMLLRPVGMDSIPAVEEITLYQTDAIAITMLGWGDLFGVRAWNLEITDSLDETVRRIGGDGAPPARVVWDGRDQRGRRVDVDEYSYRLHWRDASGVDHQTITRNILVARQVMQRTLEFGVQKTPLEDLQRRRPTLILDPGRQGLIGGEEKNQTGGSE